MVPRIVEDHRKRLAPVSLPAKQPITKLEVRPTTTLTPRFQPVDDRHLRRRCIEPVKAETFTLAVHRDTVAPAGRFPIVAVACGGPYFSDNLTNRKPERASEFKVALIMGGDGHNRPGSVAGENVVGGPNRNPLVGGGIVRISPGKDTGLFFRIRHAIDIGAIPRRGHVRRDHRIGIRRNHFVDQRVLRCDHHVGRAEKRVGPSGEDVKRFHSTLDFKFHQGALAATDPLALHNSSGFRPLDEFKIIEEALGIRGDAEHPLAEWFPGDRMITALASPANHLFVGQNRPELGAPVDRLLPEIGESLIIEIPTPSVGVHARPVDWITFGVGWNPTAIIEAALEFCDWSSLLSLGIKP